MDVKDVFKELKEYWNFKRFFAADLAKQVWYLQVVLAIAWLFCGDFFGLGTKIVVAIIWLTLSRLWTEFFIVLFSIADLLRDVRDRLPIRVDEPSAQ